MSLLALTVLGAGGLVYLSRNDQFRNEKQRRKERTKDRTNVAAVDRALSTGNYGDMADLANMIQYPGYVIGQKMDVDLTGVPYRWLLMRNGCVYKTYDTETQYF